MDAPPKTSVPQPLRHEIASVRRDVNMPFWGNVMLPQDDVLISRGQGRGLRIYREIARDAHAFAVLNKRKNAVIARDWEVKPGGKRHEDKKAAELAKRFLDGEWGFNFDATCKALLSATLMGFAVAELIWGVTPEGFILPVTVKPRRQERFRFSLDGEPRLITAEHMADGEALPPRKFLVHRFGDAEDDPYGLGLGHQLFWPVLFKRQGVAFWMVFADKFGSPTVKGEYDLTMLDADQVKLLNTLSNLAQDNAVIVPKGTVLDYLEAARSGTVTYPDLVRYMDEQISEAVLGETLTTNAGEKGARSLGEVHNDVRTELTDGDADLLSGGPLNGQLLAWITEINYPNAAPATVWRPRPEGEEDRAKAQKAKAEAKKATVEAVTAARTAGYAPENATGSLDEHLDGAWTYVGKPPTSDATPPTFVDPARDAADDWA
ncbi:MAG: DUF935 family protein, partial [Rhodospirillaceae bacterium]|nr:DUF935 family protein [Rhodospirillaceae bacterium]